MGIKISKYKKQISNIGKLLVLSLIIYSCDGFQPSIVEVDIPVEDVAEVVVMNGEIEKDSTVWVQINYSNDINSLTGTPIRFEEDAFVELKTGKGATEILKYWRNGIYYGTTIRGEVNETYTLTIDLGDRTFSATSTMYPEPGFQGAWVASLSETEGKGGKGGSYGGYEEEWIVNDPSTTRNRYLFEWYTNGVHDISRDWCIDDNRVVNVNEGLRLVNPTRGINANEHIVFRVAEIDKVTYDYYNMYEKIVRRLISADSQTPYNPVSNFGEGSMGNFRAVEFSSITILTPSGLTGVGQNGQNVITFELNKLFIKYNLYWSNTAGVTNESNALINIQYKTGNGGSKDDKDDGGSKAGDGKSVNIDGGTGTFVHSKLENGQSYYYRMEVEDAEGVISVLSPEINIVPDPKIPADGNPDVGGSSIIPTNVIAVTGNNSGQIVISWDDAIGATSHGVYWSLSPGIDGKSKNSAIWNGKGVVVKSPYTLKGLKSGSTYYIKVASFDGKEIHLSDEVNAIAN